MVMQMSETRVKVFVVDDDAVSRMILLDELGEAEFEIFEYETGKQCVENLNLKPDLILMDVEMPEMNGYEACRKIKSDTLTQDIDVVFISSHDSIEEKLEGYSAGGSDYIIKPIQPEEVKHKIELAVKNMRERYEQHSEIESAMKTATIAISNIGEQGIILDFTKQSYTIKQPAQLGRALINVFSAYGVDATLQIRTSLGTLNVSSREPVAPLEIELLSRLKDAGRIQEYGARLIANFSALSLLIKKMPEDEDKRGRLRDHLALLLEIAESRLEALEMELNLKRVVVDARQSLANVEQMQQTQKSVAMQIMDTTLTDLEEAFMTCGLTEEQEHLLLQLVQNGVDMSLENFEKGLKIDEALQKIIDRLEVFAE